MNYFWVASIPYQPDLPVALLLTQLWNGLGLANGNTLLTQSIVNFMILLIYWILFFLDNVYLGADLIAE